MFYFAEDQAKFMTACGQTVGTFNPTQARLYVRLVDEEAWETHIAKEKLWGHDESNLPTAKQLDAKVAELTDGLIDLIVVSLGALHSLGVDVNAAWDEVHRSNMAKVDPHTGKVERRADGKILKPEGWTPPDLLSVVRQSWQIQEEPA